MKKSKETHQDSAIFNTLNRQNRLERRLLTQNRILFITLVIAIIAVTVTSTLFNNDRFYIINENALEEVIDRDEIIRLWALDNISLLLAMNELNAPDRIQKLFQHTGKSSKARQYLLQVLQARYVENTAALGIIRNFFVENSEVKQIEKKLFDVTITGRQVNYTIDGKENKKVKFRIQIAQIPPDPENGFELGLIITDIEELETLII